MQLKVSCYQEKIVYCNYKMFYVSLMVTTKQETVTDIDMIKGRESKLSNEKKKKKKKHKNKQERKKDLQNNQK